MTNAQVIAALQAALRADPKNGVLWMHVARLHEEDGDLAAAIAALRAAAEIAASKEAASRALVPLLRRTGQLAEALIRAETLLEKGEDAALRAELDAIEAERAGAPQRDASVPAAPSARGEKQDPPPIAIAPGGAEESKQDWAAQFDWGDLRVTFEDVVGLETVKTQIRLRIIAPFQNPKIYAAFQREGGGGILLYGPPGCGKTFVARATAGELGARFLSIGIHDVVDKYWGESEKYVHALFEEARRKSPAVLFFDEFDTLGGARGSGGDSRFWRSLIDQLLQEMDGLRGKNRDVLVFAATNMPWDVDAAFRRPGRFDRVLFVPPPDEAARTAMLERFSQKLPGRETIDLGALARKTDLFTGADLRAFCERAGERALERSLSTGEVHPVQADDFERALRDARSTALEWLATARNYARYSNEGGQYDELTEYLKRVKRW